MKTKLSILIGLLLASYVSVIFAYPGESIVRDANGDYLITYWNGAKMKQTKFVPATKIEPTVISALKLADAWLITYRYTIYNGVNAKQPITQIMIGGISNIYRSQPLVPFSSVTDMNSALSAFQSSQAPMVQPNLWNGLALPDPENNSLVQSSWDFSTEMHPHEIRIGIPHGSYQQGFGYDSFDLPGIGAAKLEGDTPIQQGYEDEGPSSTDSEIVSQLNQIESNDFVARNTAIPTIAIPDPFDPAATLERIQAHMHTWIAQQLIEPAFAAQLDSHFKTAADVYRKQGPAGNGQIGRMLALLVQQYEGLEKGDEELVKKKSAVPAQIDKLAALVLYFDLKYVMRRMGGGN